MPRTDLHRQRMADFYARGEDNLPATLYFGLSLTDPAGSYTEPGGSYARVGVARSSGAWDAASTTGQSASAADLTFPDITGTDWGECGWLLCFESSGGSDLLGWGQLASTISAVVGASAPTVPAGALILEG